MKQHDRELACHIEWADPEKFRARKVVSRSNAGVTGKYPSLKAGRMVQWESRLELDAFMLYDSQIEVRSLREQPAKITFRFNGEERVHYPDLYVETDQGSGFVEIKEDKEAADPYVKARAEYLSAALTMQGYDYTLLTETEIRREPHLSNAKFLLRHGRRTLPLLEEEHWRRTLTEFGEVRWGAVQDGLMGPEGIQNLCRLVLDGVLAIDLDSVWTDTTPVVLVGS